LKQRGIDVTWMGTARGIESRLVPEAGYTLNLISVQGLRGNGLVGWLTAPFKLIKSVVEAMRALKEHQVDLVLGLGGFASGPGGVAAWLLRKPVVIHEQNAIPGLTNKLLARIADKVLQGFPNSFKASTHAEWVGNPVRASIEALSAPALKSGESKCINLLVLGGSLGAKALNQTLPEAIALIGEGRHLQVRHQCGVKNLEDCQAHYQRTQVEAEVTAFIDDMAEAYAWADIVVCRAGALTIAEISAAGIGAILVPYPYAVDDHQTKNASALVNVGAAVLIDESILTSQRLADEIMACTLNNDRLFQMAKAARSQAKPEAANTIADICMAVKYG